MKRLTFLFLALAVVSPLVAQANRFGEFQSVKIIQTRDPVFPEHLAAQYHNGARVRVLLSVTNEGRLEEYLVVSYTAREFAEAAVAALKEWRFEPAVWRGEPVAICTELEFNFEVKGCIVSMTPADTVASMMTSLLGKDAYAPCTLRDLDRIPEPIATVSPRYPKDLAARGLSGEIAVEFYIDEQGRVRMPFVLGRPPLDLAQLAVDAVRQWRFEPPTRKGAPVLVHVRQVFRFNPDAPAKS